MFSANVDPSLIFVTGTSSMSTSTRIGFYGQDVDSKMTFWFSVELAWETFCILCNIYGRIWDRGLWYKSVNASLTVYFIRSSVSWFNFSTRCWRCSSVCASFCYRCLNNVASIWIIYILRVLTVTKKGILERIGNVSIWNETIIITLCSCTHYVMTWKYNVKERHSTANFANR